MRNLKLLLLAIFLFPAACSQDDMLTLEKELARSGQSGMYADQAKKPVPLKVHFSTVLNQDPEPMPGDPNGWLSGNATHFGKLDTESSPYWYTGIEPTGNPDYPVKYSITNILTAANGDRAVAEGYLIVASDMPVFYGRFELKPNPLNTGKFVGINGWAEISPDNPGFTDPETGVSTWEAEGKIVFQ